MELIPIIAIVSMSAVTVLIVYFVTRGRQRRIEAQVMMQTRLIDRFTSGPELAEFLQSPAGRQFVNAVETSPAAHSGQRIMTGFNRAIVLTMLGLAFLFLTIFSDDDFVVPAAILFSLGLGNLFATLLSYKLSSKLLGEATRES
ncbi:MAG TPA: hypothetical protein VF911_05120 [Thermoanaerobaculia bacterium]|jgi:hypothetical protein